MQTKPGIEGEDNGVKFIFVSLMLKEWLGLNLGEKFIFNVSHPPCTEAKLIIHITWENYFKRIKIFSFYIIKL